MADERLVFPIGFDLEEGVKEVESQWKSTQKRLENTFKANTIEIDADISEKVLNKLYNKFEGLIKSLETKAPQIKLKMPNTVDFEEEIKRLKVQLKSINLGELTDAESKDLYLYIRQLEALAKALKEVNKQEQLRQANNPANIALRQAQAEEKRTRAIANSALAEQRRAKIATESARQSEINNRSTQKGAILAEQKRAATARAEQAELRLTQAKERSTRATQSQNTAYATQSNYLQRLIQRMSVYFGIHQAMSFVRNIHEVTAEFELQRVALGALIQDAYKANQIFESIKVQAVKSPYEVKDLVTYTKRLAAYGVEADALMDTMNRLADISAGLGADMDRIILAYGQIQAAGVLKGTELKQLTELGIPMVELLAQYYSTLRNEVVTTSDVFDMISKKEIPFEAVKDVLGDLTDEGGRFFDMQSKQAETLAGQWSNMKDSLSIMFDEMGRTDEVRGMLSSLIEMVKWLTMNWERLGNVVKWVAYTYVGLKGANAIIKTLTASTLSLDVAQKRFAKSQQAYRAAAGGNLRALNLQLQFTRRATLYQYMAAKATTTWSRTINVLKANIMKLLATNVIGWIMLIVGALASLAIIFGESKDAMDSFRESQREAVKESMENTTLMVANFKRLVNEALKSADGSERQNQALRKLKQQYGEMFPEYKLTIDYLRSMTDEAGTLTGAFSDMESTIRNFSAERMRLNLIENYQKQLEGLYSDTFSKLTDEYGANFAKEIGQITSWAFEDGITQAELQEKVLDAFLKATNQSLADFQQNLRNLDDGLIETFKRETALIDDDTTLSELLEVLSKEGTGGQADALVLLLTLAEAFRKSNGEIENMMQSFDDLDPKMKSVNSRIEKLNTELKEIGENTGGKTTENVENAIKQAETEAINKALADLFAMEYIEIEPPFILNLDTLDDAIEQAKSKGYELSDAFYSGIKSVRAIAGDYDDVWKEDMANMVAYLDNGTRKVQAYSSDQIGQFNKLWDAIPEVAKRYKELNEQLEGLKKTYDALKSKPIDEQDTQEIENYRKEISNVETIMQFLYSFLEKYGGLDLLKEKDKSKVNPDIKKLEDEYAMVEKIYKKYEEFRKFMGDEQARIEVDKYFEGVDLQWLDKAFSTDELKSQAQEALRILKTFWGDTKKAQQNLQFKIGDIAFDDTKRELEDRLKKLADDISHTKTAKDFFDRMLGMTGNRELSASLTLSVYGTTGDDLQKLMTQQILDAFKGVDISEAMLGGNKWDYNVLEGFVEQLPEEQRQNAQSIVDNWRKANADILTDLQKSYEDFMTYEERKTRVVERELANRKKIEESQYTKDEKDKLLRASREAEKKELGAIAIEEFKASDDWIKSFEDLENLATPTIERLMTKLKEFITLNKEALTPEQLKSLMGEYDKLYNGLITRNPIQAITDSIKEYKTAMQGVKLAQDALDAAKAMGDEDLIAFAERGLTDAFDDAQKATSKLQKGLSGLSDKFSQAQQFVSSFTDTLGISEDTQFGAFLNGISDALGGVSKALAFAQLAVQLFDGTIKSFLASNPIGWILLIVSAIISAVQAIANARIKRIDQDIERLEDRLDSLSYAYDRLQKAQEKAFGTDYISNYEQRMANLVAQQDAYLKQAELERSKGKKADEDKIKEYENAARDTADEIKDMQSELSEYFLGTDLTSAARDFANAWIDAYKEFGNTTDAMKEKFQDMIQNMIVESFAAKVIQTALEPIFDSIDDMSKDGVLDMSEAAEIARMTDTAVGNIDVGMTNLMNAFSAAGISVRGMGSELTGISRDIATASEESILGLAAGINTQNFYISQVPPKLDVIIGLLQGGNLTQGSAITLQDLVTIQNQHLSYLPSIAQHTADTVAECKQIVAETRRTADALERVIKPRGVTSTHTLNATIGS